MYESPINKIYSDMTNKLAEDEEGHMMLEIRQAIGYDINKDELIKALQYDRHQYEKGFNDAKSLEQQPCEDCVSREAVNILVDELARVISDERCFIPRGRSTASIMQDILHLSSVTPELKKGRWIKYGPPRCGEQHYRCTACDDYINFGVYSDYYLKAFKYCPFCGAKMEIEE